MLARAFFAVLVLPGTVAFLVPLMLFRSTHGRFSGLGILPLAAGSTLLLWCVREFYVVRKGTPATWAPPRHLVTTGLYRYSRNPIYLSVMLILLGWTLGFQSRSMTIYAVIVPLAFHLRVISFEEPWLAQRYVDQWIAYQRKVPRWLPLVRNNRGG